MIAGIVWMGLGIVLYLVRKPLSKVYAWAHRELSIGGGAAYEIGSNPKTFARSAVTTFVIGVLLLLNGLGIIHLPIKA